DMSIPNWVLHEQSWVVTRVVGRDWNARRTTDAVRSERSSSPLPPPPPPPLSVAWDRVMIRHHTAWQSTRLYEKVEAGQAGRWSTMTAVAAMNQMMVADVVEASPISRSAIREVDGGPD